VLVTLYSNPFTIVPLYWLAFKLGQRVLQHNGSDLPAFDITLDGRGYLEWLHAALQWLGSVGKPLLVGVPLLAVLLAVVGYFLTDWAWRLGVRWQWQRRKRNRNHRRSTRP